MIWRASENEYLIKVVYIGPFGAGKRTMLEQISGQKRQVGRGLAMPPLIVDGAVNPDFTAEIIENVEDSIDASSFVPMRAELPNGASLRFHIFSVHSESECDQTRALGGADAFVLVVNSELAALESNIRAAEKLRAIVKPHEGTNPIPAVLQMNKRDMPEIVPVDDLLACLGWTEDYFESVAPSGEGVNIALQTVLRKLDFAAARQF